jgi:putative endopeptidase
MRPTLARFSVALALVLLPVAAAAQTQPRSCRTAQARSGAASAAAPSVHGWDARNMDRRVSPCTDFYQYADGGWLARNPIPPAYSSWGIARQMQAANEAILRGILERAAAEHNAPSGSVDQKLGDFYASCMNAAAIEAEGIQPLLPEFHRIDVLSSLSGVVTEAARLQETGGDVLFQFGSEQDEKNSSQEIAVAAQGGLGLPDRDYYTKTDPRSRELRRQYVVHVTRMFELLGDAPARAAEEAATVMSIETKLAEASMTELEQRDPQAIYHKMAVSQLESLTPNLAWQAYFGESGMSGLENLNVRQPKFFQALNAELQSVPLPAWKTYLRWHLIHAAAPALSSKFVNEDFDFYSRILTGAKQLQPRWKRCVRAADGELGFALGQKYVEKQFPPSAKSAALLMVQNLMIALREDIQTLPWMAPSTKQAALAKLDKMGIKIGYPDRWRDYSAYRVARGPYVLNLFGGEAFEFRRELAKIGKPLDRTEWGMTPPTINAYYDPLMNEIVFPAGILQPPLFDFQADDAVNYGSMGAIIGHEMTHGFDDEGSQFDAAGNLKNWWTPDDLKNFKARAECVAEQFDGYVAIDNIHENGHLELGESIADLGGLVIAYKAFQKTPEAKSSRKIGGFTPDQRFFLAYARSWENNNRPELTRLQVNTDPHPLPRLRAIGPLSNMPAFAQAFGCHAGDAMVRPPAEVCRIW